MFVRKEVWPFLLASLVIGLGVGIAVGYSKGSVKRGFAWGGAVAGVSALYMLYFFRDPKRTSPSDRDAVVAAADGHVAAITNLTQDVFRKLAESSGLKESQLGRLRNGDVTRISIFLSLFDVHVNRAPIAGASTFLGYFPGKRLFTFQDKSSEVNQHNSILIENARTACLVNQIVGPVCRRVVYWPDPKKPVPLKIGDRIGMMKFGSRLDMYLPTRDITVTIGKGAKTAAGVTVVARLR